METIHQIINFTCTFLAWNMAQNSKTSMIIHNIDPDTQIS